MSKRTRGTTKDANRRRESHARKETLTLKAKLRKLFTLRHARRKHFALMRESVCCYLERSAANPKMFAETFLGREVESARWGEPGHLIITEKAIMLEFICDIGPDQELTAERARFLSVLGARA